MFIPEDASRNRYTECVWFYRHHKNLLNLCLFFGSACESLLLSFMLGNITVYQLHACIELVKGMISRISIF